MLTRAITFGFVQSAHIFEVIAGWTVQYVLHRSLLNTSSGKIFNRSNSAAYVTSEARRVLDYVKLQ